MEESASGPTREEGLKLLKAGQVDDAIRVLGDLLRQNMDDAQLHMYLGIAYGQKNDKLHAIHHLETSVNLEENPKVLYNLGLIYESSHRIDEAVRQYRRSIQLDPDYTLAQQALHKLQEQFAAAHIQDAPVGVDVAAEPTVGMPAAAPPAVGHSVSAPPSGPPDFADLQAKREQDIKDAHRTLMSKGVIYGAICGGLFFVLLSLLAGMLIASYSGRAALVYLLIQFVIGGIYGGLIGLWMGFTAGDEMAGAQAGAVLAFVYGLVLGLVSRDGVAMTIGSALFGSLFGAIGGYIIGRLVESSIQQV